MVIRLAEMLLTYAEAAIELNMITDEMYDAIDAVTSFGFRGEAEKVTALARGPLMQRYSKALEYEYSPSLRGELIAGAYRMHEADIERALAMLRASAEKSLLLERALGRTQVN